MMHTLILSVEIFVSGVIFMVVGLVALLLGICGITWVLDKTLFKWLKI